MKFDLTVTLGNLMSIGAMLVALTVGYTKLDARQQETNRRIETAERLATARELRVRANEIALAAQSSDLRNIQNGIDDIKETLNRLSQKTP